jgi:hypothetical protein
MSWIYGAAEGATLTVPAGARVRYGVDTRWVEKVCSGAITCSNAFFGSDPAPGVVKQAQVWWTQVAVEGGDFTVSGTQTVRYGAGASWITKSVSGAGVCSNTFFGSDPVFGVAKVCELLVPVSAPPSPTPSPAPSPAPVPPPPPPPPSPAGPITIGSDPVTFTTVSTLSIG